MKNFLKSLFKSKKSSTESSSSVNTALVSTPSPIKDVEVVLKDLERSISNWKIPPMGSLTFI